jgi:quercetin dioxygenase-like cupin family protein
MKIIDNPYTIVDWSKIPPVNYPGETGFAVWRTVELGNIRVRMVEYSAGYLADHWCGRGHVILVLEGEIISELKDGSKSLLTAGMGYQVSDGTAPHRSSTEKGAKLFIVD